MINRRMLLKTMTASVVAGPLANLRASASFSQVSPTNRVLRLDLNENAYGPSTAAIATIREHAPSASRFPQGSGLLREALSKFLGVATEQILPAAGTDEILRMSAAAFLGPKRNLVLATPTYDAMMIYAKAVGAEAVSIPLRKDHGHDLDTM